MDGGAWKAAVHGVAEGWTRLSDFTFTFHFHALEKEMATHSSYSCLENPRDRGAWWAAICGVTQSWTWLKWLSSSSSRDIHNKMFYFHNSRILECSSRVHNVFRLITTQVALTVKSPSANAEDVKRHGFNPWVGKIPWRRAQQPTPVFLPWGISWMR